MTSERTNVFVFTDEAGEYYLLPQATLEQCRVPAERKAEVERLIAASDDTAGYAIQDRFRTTVPLLYLAGASFTWGEYGDALTFVGQAIGEVQKGLGGPAW